MENSKACMAGASRVSQVEEQTSSLGRSLEEQSIIIADLHSKLSDVLRTPTPPSERVASEKDVTELVQAANYIKNQRHVVEGNTAILVDLMNRLEV